MRICRFTTSSSGTPRFGLIEDGKVLPFAEGESIGAFQHQRTDVAVAISEVTLLAPVAPSKIVCVGRNYREHAAELGNDVPKSPLLFLKAPSARTM